VICDNDNPGFFFVFAPSGAATPFGCGEPGKPPANFRPLFSAREGFFADGTTGAECVFLSVGAPLGNLKPAGIPPGIAIEEPVGVSVAPGAKSRLAGCADD
jgi:hypothetical protein